MGRSRKAVFSVKPFEVEVLRQSHEGRGIASYEGRTVFIDGALKNEKIVTVLRSKKGKFYEAQAVSVIRASEDRVEPPCEFSEYCGGCSLQHMHTDAQLTFKQSVVQEQLKHFGGIEPLEGFSQPLVSPTMGYRRKARLGVKHAKNKGVLVGFRERYSHYVHTHEPLPDFGW